MSYVKDPCGAYAYNDKDESPFLPAEKEGFNDKYRRENGITY